jgi:hypothetical protein
VLGLGEGKVTYLRGCANLLFKNASLLDVEMEWKHTYIHTYMLVQCKISEIQRLRDLWMGWLEWLENGFLDVRDRDLIGRNGHGHGNAAQPMLATALQPIITAMIHISQ